VVCTSNSIQLHSCDFSILSRDFVIQVCVNYYLLLIFLNAHFQVCTSYGTMDSPVSLPASYHPVSSEPATPSHLPTSVTTMETIQLKRSVGLFSAVGLIIGVIVGSGIFVSPKGVLLYSGSIGMALVVWTITGFICLIGALCLAELGCCISSSGGMYAYIRMAFGDLCGFLYLWTSVLIVFPAANAVIALTFAFYILYPFFPGCDPPQASIKILATAAIGECVKTTGRYPCDFPLQLSSLF
jgi:hypothetical protein